MVVDNFSALDAFNLVTKQMFPLKCCHQLEIPSFLPSIKTCSL